MKQELFQFVITHKGKIIEEGTVLARSIDGARLKAGRKIPLELDVEDVEVVARPFE